MKYFLLTILVLSSFFLAAQSDSTVCRSFSEGEFTYVNEDAEEISVKRNRRIQEEYNIKKDIKTRFRISWKSACVYEIKQVWSNSKKLRKQNGAITVIHMTNPSDNSYVFECTCRGLENRKKGLMIRKSE